MSRVSRATPARPDSTSNTLPASIATLPAHSANTSASTPAPRAQRNDDQRARGSQWIAHRADDYRCCAPARAAGVGSVKSGASRSIAGTRMNKAFTNEDAAAEAFDDDDVDSAPPLPQGTRNYMTPGGYARLKASSKRSTGSSGRSSWRRCRGRPATATARRTATTSTARSGCARSTGASASSSGGSTSPKSSTRRRAATTTTPTRCSSARRSTVADRAGDRAHGISIVGIDEIDTARGYISWISPMARALLKAREGDVVTLAHAGRRRGARSAGACATRRSPRAPVDALHARVVDARADACL